MTIDPPRDASEYVIVHLPIRLGPEQIAFLSAAAARAPNTKAVEISVETRDRAQVARVEVDRIVKLRRQRDRVLGAKMFADPAWDMLLDLFVRCVDQVSTSISSACLASKVPPTTALRHMAILMEQGLVTKTPSRTDLRKHYVTLSNDGFEHMVEIFAPAGKVQRASAPGA